MISQFIYKFYPIDTYLYFNDIYYNINKSNDNNNIEFNSKSNSILK